MRDDPPTSEDPLERYLILVREDPSLFANPAKNGYQILLDRAEIRSAEGVVCDRLKSDGLPVEWARVGIVYEDRYIRVLRDAVRFPDGELGTYIRLIGQPGMWPGVAILPVCDDRIVLLRHYRHATRSWHLEIPRGFGELGLDSEFVALKELSEEISAESPKLTLLGRVHPDTGMSAGSAVLYFAEVSAIGKPDAREAIADTVSVSSRELERLIDRDEVTDSFTIAAYARARLRGLL